MAARSPILWIDWGRHLRTRTLSQQLGVELVEICFGGARIWRYARCLLATAAAIRSKRPQIVIATNPSIVLGYLLLFLRKWHGFKLVSDAHYVGVRAIPARRIMQRLLDFHNSRVDLVVVTNENHARLLQRLGARTYVCQDPLPDLPCASRLFSVPPKSVFLICSFDVDEPYEAAFTAFSSLAEQGYSLLVCGNYMKARIDVSRFPWVRFLGFVSTEDYYRYLRSCAVVMDLTTLEDCLVCGAYEAIAAGKALVVSKTSALNDYFGDVVVLTDNTAAAIRESVVVAHSRRDDLTRKAEKWAARNRVYMRERIAGLQAELSSF
jgi:glycosyltransferase involved in cell wall biosynthesis